MKLARKFSALSARIPYLLPFSLFILPWLWISSEHFQSSENFWFYFECFRAFGLPLAGGILCFVLARHVKKFNTLKTIFLVLLSYPAFLFFTSLLNSKDLEHLILVMFMLLVPVYFSFALNYMGSQGVSNSDTVFQSIFMAIFFLLCLKISIFMFKDVFLGLIYGIYNGYSTFDVFAQKFLSFYPPRSSGMARSAVLLIGFSCYAFLVDQGHKKKLTVLVGLSLFALFFYQSRGGFVILFVGLASTACLLSKEQRFELLNYLKSGLLVFLFLYSTFLIYSKSQVGQISQIFRNFATVDPTGGRLFLWRSSESHILENIWFGLGIQADRLVLDGHSVSNFLIYALLSGGIFSGVLITLLMLCAAASFIWLVRFRYIKRKSLSPEHLISFFTLSVIGTRGIFENSVSVFGIDFILFYTAIVILYAQMARSQQE